MYQRAGAVKKNDGTTIVLDVGINLHSLDCGAPDCWGHHMDLTLRVEAGQGRCDIVGATSSARPYNDCGMPMDGRTAPWTNTFTVVNSPNLAESGLERIELRDLTRAEALVLLPYDYYFFDGVTANTPLKEELQGEQPPRGFSYGYASSTAQYWRTEYWLSPLAISEPTALEGAELDAFNRWATAAELRDDLDELARRGFGLSKRARLRHVFQGGEPATGATVTAEDAVTDHEAIRARRIVLQFSRKACSGCATGISGWWLWKANVSYACKPGYGHEGFSNEPCSDK